jgi:photosystem II stability/assembly factor-like uncharacterized protein
LYRTDDAGATWRKLAVDAIPVALSFVADAFRPDTLWGNSLVTVNFPATLYRSTDGGTTWNVVAAPEGGRWSRSLPTTGPSSWRSMARALRAIPLTAWRASSSAAATTA